MPPESWTDIRDAKKPGEKCPQMNPYGKAVVEGSEDCLYLNVYTPSLPDEKNQNLPVIFFVHGGRLVLGYGDYYKPDYLIRNDVILVTINYRLNVFGFLCLDIPEVPGNAGLKDTIMALKWVKRNIRHFNGDDNNITAYGESAGAAIVSSYLTSKMAGNLFNKVICQSGVSVSDLFIMMSDDPVTKASEIAKHLGHSVTDKVALYEIFRSTPVDDLVSAFVSAEMSRPPAVIHAFLMPVVERHYDGVERFFDELPLVAFRENRFRKVPIIVTINSMESALFVNKDGDGGIIYEDLKYYIPSFLQMDHGTERASRFVTKLRDYYFGDRSLDENVKIDYLNLTSDHYFARDTMLFVELVSKYHKDIYMCRFDYNGNVNTSTIRNMGLQGASHGDLVQYVFYRSSKLKVASDSDVKIIDMLTEAWCNFVKSG